MEGLRNLYLSEDIRPFEVRRPKFKEGYPEASIREGPEELTLRAEEVGCQKSCINVDHIAEDRWGPPMVDADWQPFAKQSTKEFKAANGRICTSTAKK